MVEQLALGRTELRVSRIGFGCAAIGGYDYGPVNDGDSIRAVHHALDLGINVFDTAAVYGLGHSEQVLGRALAGRRERVVVATKFGVAWDDLGRTHRDASPKRIVEEADASLRRLGVDRIDVFQLHWPDGRTPMEEVMHALERLRRAGKIGAAGLCNVGIGDLDTAQRHGRVETLQLPYSLVDRDHEATLKAAVDRYGMGVLLYNVLAHGFLTGRYTSQSAFAGSDLRARPVAHRDAAHGIADTVRRVAERFGRSPAQVALRWVAQALPGGVVLAGMKRSQQVQENVAVTEWELDEAAMTALHDCAPASTGPTVGSVDVDSGR